MDLCVNVFDIVIVYAHVLRCLHLYLSILSEAPLRLFIFVSSLSKLAPEPLQQPKLKSVRNASILLNTLPSLLLSGVV